MDIIIALVVIVIVGAAVLYIYRARKRGQKCIGCPYSKTCGGNCGCADK